MRAPRFISLILVSSLLGAFSASRATIQPAVEFPTTDPESVGISSERLSRLDAWIRRMVDEKQFAGVVAIAARHGKIFFSHTYGSTDTLTRVPMTSDEIFHIYSMTKPVTGVAMMILYEDGKWNPQEPISKYIPEFANLKVFKGVDASGRLLLVKPDHPPTMRELMTHTAGFSYGYGSGPIDKLYQNGNGRNIIVGAPSLQDMIERLSKIPLLYQPGTRWVYSVSADIQGYLVQKLSSEPLPKFLKERIFVPLGMKDTGFFVPHHQRDKLATLYRLSGTGTLERVWDKGLLDIVPAGDKKARPTVDKDPPFPSGGAGLLSTADDYLRFAQMLLNRGELGGVRILGPETVRMMTANHLPDALMTGDGGGGGGYTMRSGFGFGCDVSVYTDPFLADDPSGKGTFWWDGAAGTWFWVDPTDDIVFVGMVQKLGMSPGDFPSKFARQLTYQALVDPRK